MTLKSGLQLYSYRFDGTIASPGTYTLIQFVRDESISMERTQVDASSRASATFRQYVPGLADGTVEMQINHLPGDSIFDEIQAAWIANTILNFAIVDGPFTLADAKHGETGDITVTGLWGAFYVTGFSEQRALEDAHVHDIILSPTLEPSTNAVPIYQSLPVTLA